MGEEGSGVRTGVLAVLGVVALVLGWGAARPDSLQGRGSWAPVDSATITVSVAEAGSALWIVGLTPGQLRLIRLQHDTESKQPLVRLYADPAYLDDPGFPATPTHVEIHDGILVLRPLYPLLGGHEYHVGFDSGSLGDAAPTTVPIRVPASAPTPPARVSAIYPSSDRIPENQLKMYVEFSRPMLRWDVYTHLSLVDVETGESVPDPFHSMREGLWDVSGTRLTVVFDPGRIKRGLANHERFGAPLRADRAYRLIIDEAWPDRSGRPLGRSVEKQFMTVAADRTSPRPTEWTLEVPEAGSRNPLVVRFSEPLDRALLESALVVEGSAGWAVEGRGSPGEGEAVWTFVPLRAWPAGEYNVRVDPRIEDLAGNSVLRLFDVDLAADGATPEQGMDEAPEDVLLPFSIRSVPPAVAAS